MPGSHFEARARVDRPGMHGVDRLAHVLRREPAGEHQPPFDRSGPVEVRGVCILPRAGRPRSRPVPRRGAARRRGRAPSFGPLVELDEIGAVPSRLADADGHGEHRVRERRGPPRRARALLDEDEAAQIGTGLDRDGDVLLPREAADLDERPGDQLRERAAGSARAHQRGADQDGVGAGQLGLGALRAARDGALGDHDAIARRAGDERRAGPGGRSRRSTRSRALIADRVGAERDGALELRRVVGLDERVEPDARRVGHERGGAAVVEIAQDQQGGVGAGRLEARRAAPPRVKKPFASSGRAAAARAARRSSIEPAKRSSTSTDTAAAPACSNAAARLAGSASGRRSPADGDRRLTSAIAARPGPRAARKRVPYLPDGALRLHLGAREGDQRLESLGSTRVDRRPRRSRAPPEGRRRAPRRRSRRRR